MKLDIIVLLIFSLEHIVFQNADVVYSGIWMRNLQNVFDRDESLLCCK